MHQNANDTTGTGTWSCPGTDCKLPLLTQVWYRYRYSRRGELRQKKVPGTYSRAVALKTTRWFDVVDSCCLRNLDLIMMIQNVARRNNHTNARQLLCRRPGKMGLSTTRHRRRQRRAELSTYSTPMTRTWLKYQYADMYQVPGEQNEEMECQQHDDYIPIPVFCT